MAWQDRLIEAAYTSSGGTRIAFPYEDVSRSFDKKTSAFEFPDASGTYVQDLGKTGMRYPMRIFFWGDDYDIASSAFEEILSETGIGRLEHPLYGVINVVPFGTISRRDDLKTAANQSVIEVTFWETIELVYPLSQADNGAAVISAVDEYNQVKADEFNALASLGTEVERANFKTRYNSLLKTCKSGLQKVADAQENVQRQFNAINDSINRGIDVLVRDPIALSFQTSQLIQAPARALFDIKERLIAYDDLLSSIISGEGAVVSPSYDSQSANVFQSNDLYAAGYITGSALSVVNNQFETKREALESAEEVIAQFQEWNTWREQNFNALALVDEGDSYQKVLDAVSYAAGYLVQISFTLKEEVSITLDRNRTIIDLCAELYGNIDESLDFFIQSNELTGDEILELPRGREIVYYI